MTISKIDLYGNRGIVPTSIKPYTQCRRQCVKLYGGYSNPKEFSCGVPQRYVLGLVLFFILNNELQIFLLFSNRFCWLLTEICCYRNRVGCVPKRKT